MIKIYQIAYKNLLRKKTRSALTLIGIALSTWVLVSLLGFNNGYETSLNKDIDNLGFQILVTAKGCPYEAATLMLKGGTGLRYMDESITVKITADKDVSKITPMLMQAVFDPNKGESGGISAYLGVDPGSFPQMKPYLSFKEGRWFAEGATNEAVMGYEAAELEQREVGDKLLIPETKIEFKVIGILKRSGTQDDGTIFVPIRNLQNVFKKQGKITAIGIKVNKDTDISKFEEKMYELPDVQVISLIQVKQTIIGLVSTAKVMVLSIAIIAILISLIGVLNTILMSVIERQQEIGILKAIGAMAGDIFKLIWLETIFLCAAGGLVGIIMALATSAMTEILVRKLLPYAPSSNLIMIDWKIIMLSLSAIVFIGLISGIYPAWKAGSIRPLESIRKGEIE